jgi:hypothetical protein
VVLNAELLRIQKALRTILETIRTVLSLKYVVLDGHFGNYPSAWMVRQENLHLISKMQIPCLMLQLSGGKVANLEEAICLPRFSSLRACLRIRFSWSHGLFLGRKLTRIGVLGT